MFLLGKRLCLQAPPSVQREEELSLLGGWQYIGEEEERAFHIDYKRLSLVSLLMGRNILVFLNQLFGENSLS